MTLDEYRSRLADKLLGPVAPVATAPQPTQPQPKETADAKPA